MTKVIKGKKVKMSQMFMDDGRVVPVTIIKSTNSLSEDLKEKKIVVVGTSKGKGFAGVMKRWGFAGGYRTHGQSNKPRAAGAIGSQTPGRVFKGKKMAGRMGNKRVSIKGLKIIDVSLDEGLFSVSGPIPGARNSQILVKILD